MGFLQKVKHFFVPSRENAYRPHLLRRRSLLGLLGLVLAAEALVVGNLLMRETGHPLLSAVIRSDIVALTNTERLKPKVGSITCGTIFFAGSFGST